MSIQLHYTKVLALASIVFFTACSTSGLMLDKRAQSYGFDKHVIEGDPFLHVSYQKQAGLTQLHIYLEGDGTPWLTPYIVATDPTPRRSLILDLMAIDVSDSLYLARPCYNEVLNSACDQQLWTSHRYAESVVQSMASAIQHYIKEHNYQQLALIGHSGGGSLAMLIAEHLPSTTAIITIAANLDIEAWTTLHGYSALSGSLNPAEMRPLSSDVWQLHLAGAKDRNVPAIIIENGIKQQSNAHLFIFKEYTHGCCWLDTWPDILNALASKNTQALEQKYSPRPRPVDTP